MVKIVIEPQVDCSIRYLAALVLKNTLRNHVITLKSINNPELNQVKIALLEFLVSQPNMNGAASCPRKIIKEVVFLVSKIIIQEFMNNQEDCELMIALL